MGAGITCFLCSPFFKGTIPQRFWRELHTVSSLLFPYSVIFSPLRLLSLLLFAGCNRSQKFCLRSLFFFVGGFALFLGRHAFFLFKNVLLADDLMALDARFSRPFPFDFPPTCRFPLVPKEVCDFYLGSRRFFFVAVPFLIGDADLRCNACGNRFRVFFSLSPFERMARARDSFALSFFKDGWTFPFHGRYLLVRGRDFNSALILFQGPHTGLAVSPL